MELHGSGFRVYLAPLSMEDAYDMARLADNKEIASAIAQPGSFPSPYTKENALQFIEFAAAAMLDGMREVHMGMRLEDGGTLVGVIGLKNIDMQNMRAEIGFWCGRQHWGKGYTTEAARLMLHFAFKVLRLHRVYGTAFADNERSIRLMERIGMRREGIIRESVKAGDAFISSVLLSILEGEYSDKIQTTPLE